MPQSGFMAMMADKTRDVETEDGVIEAFQVFDKDGKGVYCANLPSCCTCSFYACSSSALASWRCVCCCCASYWWRDR